MCEWCTPYSLTVTLYSVNKYCGWPFPMDPFRTNAKLTLPYGARALFPFTPSTSTDLRPSVCQHPFSLADNRATKRVKKRGSSQPRHANVNSRQIPSIVFSGI